MSPNLSEYAKHEGYMRFGKSISEAAFALTLSALLLFVAACAHTPAAVPGRDPAQIERHLLELHEQWGAARIAGDVAFLERFYGSELRLNVMSGSVVERAQDVALFDRAGKDASQVIVPEYIQDDEVSVALYGDTAVVTGVENLRGVAMGVYGEMALRFTNVLVWRDDRWQLVHHQSTRIQNR